MIHDDGWHLSDRGTIQFIKNLSLQATINKRDVRSYKEALDQPKQSVSSRRFNYWNGKRPREQITSNVTQPPNYNIPNQNEDGLPQRSYRYDHGVSYDTAQHYCEWCGETNHTTAKCRHGGPVTCLRCKLTGHKQKYCLA